MKNLIDRMCPLIEPFVELRDGRCCSVLRQGTKRGKLVLVSSCGFWGIESFDLMLAYMREVCRLCSRAFAGAVLRPHADALMPMMEEDAPLNDIFEAAKEVPVANC